MEKKLGRKNAKKVSKRKSKSQRVIEDERFKEVQADPLFDSLPTKKRKVVIDKRFKDLLADNKFSARSAIDMRGRTTGLREKNTLSDLYDLEKSEASSDESMSSENEKAIKIDLARGDGNISSTDDSDEEWDLDEDEVEEHGWGEFDKDAKRVDWTSHRLALCNMEWDRITAMDIYVVLSSFKPPAPAEIRSVTIYKSDFGKKRLEEEEKFGPRLPGVNKQGEDDDEIDNTTREALRAYQLDRMRYYYAIIDCDSDKTALAIYESCDGAEFESSAVRMDLRLVPDEMVFEESMVEDTATENDININTFKPKNFESTALSKSSTKLTWDETNPERIKVLHEAFEPDADLDQFQGLIAPASSDEDESKKEWKSKLLENADFSGRNVKKDIEVTWEPGADLVGAERGSEEKVKASTPWEKYLEKRKAKRKMRKARIAELKQQRTSEAGKGPDRFISSLSKKKASSLCAAESKSEIALDDDRFAALYSSSAFAIDQSNPLFKSTDLVMKQALEKQKKRFRDSKEDEPSALIARIKRKTEKRESSKTLA